MRRMDQGTAVGLQATGIGLTVGAILYSAHAEGMRRVQEDRDAREQAAYDAAVSSALGNAEALGRIARQAARDLAVAKAENAKLRRLLKQREGYIARMRKAAA